MNNFLFIIFSILTGLIVGFVNGFMGAGGGMLVVPALSFLFKLSSKQSHSSAVFIMLPICLVSGITYIIKGVVDFKVLLPVAIGTLIGGIIGTFLLKKLNAVVVNIFFYGVMIFAGIWIVVGAI